LLGADLTVHRAAAHRLQAACSEVVVEQRQRDRGHPEHSLGRPEEDPEPRVVVVELPHAERNRGNPTTAMLEHHLGTSQLLYRLEVTPVRFTSRPCLELAPALRFRATPGFVRELLRELGAHLVEQLDDALRIDGRARSELGVVPQNVLDLLRRFLAAILGDERDGEVRPCLLDDRRDRTVDSLRS
jgi:hypothetical protein